MIKNAELEGNIFYFDCPACRAKNSTDISEYSPVFHEEVGAFENLMVTCPNCRVQIGFNMQIPIFEAAESESFFQYAGDDERKLRNIIREIMWRRMPEFEGRDREAEEAAYIAEHGIGVPEPEPMDEVEPPPAPPIPAPPTPTEPEQEQDQEQPAEEEENAIDEPIKNQEGEI